MIRAIFNFLLGIRKVFQRFGSAAFEKLRDPATGKIKFIGVKNLRNLLLIGAGVFFLGILLTQIFGGGTPIPGGLEEFRKEMSPKLGVGESEQNYTSPFGDDPLSALNNLRGAQDPLADLKGGTTGSDGTGSTPNLNADGTPADPSLSECLDLIEKLKNGVVLSGDEKARADLCIEKNIAQLSAEELAAVKQLLREDLTAAEREALRKFLSGELDPDSLEGQIVKAMIDAAKQGDAQALQDARNALAALEAKNQELAEALLKKAEDEPLSEREKSLISSFLEKLGSSTASALDNPANATNREDLAKQLASDIASREAAIRDLQDQLARAQAEAAKAAEKVAKGLTLTPAEAEALRRLTDLQAKQAELARLQEARRQALAQLMRQLQQTLAQVTVTMQQAYPSGISVEMNDLVDCSKVKPLPFKRIAKKGTGAGGASKKPGSKEVWLTGDGEPLTPDKIKLVQLYRKKKSEEGKTRASITNPLGELGGGASIGEKVNLAEVLGEEGANIDITALTVFADRSLKSFNLTPDMKIPAILDSEILISDKGQGQLVRVRIVDDVHNPENGQIVIPKGAIAMATTSGFDPDTGTMDLNFDKVTVGSGKVVQVKLSIGSADGTMGLKGQVRDTRGKFLLGAFITSFTAGALNWFSQEIIQDFITETDAGNALLGASLQGGSDVMNRIAEMYAGDLQNAAKIFYVPRKIPVILFPQ
jgi:hypothetical protein